MTHASRQLLSALALSVALSGCATKAALRSGQQAETLQDYDRAIVEYTRALRKSPDNRDARQGLERAKTRSVQEHFTRGRRFEAVGRLDQALAELQIASELDPLSSEIEESLRSVRNQLRTKIAVSREDKTELESRSSVEKLAPLGLELPADVRARHPDVPRGTVPRHLQRPGQDRQTSASCSTQFPRSDLTLDLRA